MFSTKPLHLDSKSLLMKIDVQLRSLRDTDASEIAKLANNIKVWNNLRDLMPHPYSQNDAVSFIEMVKKEERPVTFGIEYEGNLCGVIGITPQTDVYRKSAELGYWIGEPYWGQGIATQAVEMILKYGFEHFDIERVYAGVIEPNVASMKVLERNGFIKEGVSRRAVFKNNEFHDEHKYGKLIGE